jgi:intracellular septation protein A
VQHAIQIPRIRDVLRHVVPSVVEGKLVPLALFVGCLELVGNLGALIVALVWSLGAIAYRAATGRRVPGLVVLSAVALVARTVAAVASGSMVMYFLQPTITTALVGLAFMISIPMGSPLAQRLADDVFPFDDDTKSHPLVRQFFVRLSAIWSVTSLVNASITVWLLLTQSTTTFVLVKSFLGPLTTALTLTLGIGWFRFTAARTGAKLVWAPARTRADRIAA